VEKRLVILGFLLSGPLSGYRIHRVAATHGDLYASLKRANVYYLLARLESEGLVSGTVETTGRGPTGERTVYSITAAGRVEFDRLLRAALENDPLRLGIETAAVLVRYVDRTTARRLLERRREAIQARRDRASGSLDVSAGTAADLLVSIYDAEIGWLGRAVARLNASGLRD
jgi:DNA-binding PadR family transcriptional regulator